MKSAVVRVEAVWDAIVDEPGSKTGKKVAIQGDGAKVFLFRGIPSLRPRPIETICTAQPLVPNTPVDLVLSSGRVFQLMLMCSVPDGAEDSQRPAALLVLRCGEQKQILGSYHASYEKGEFTGVGQDGEIRLIWAGDLNGDGELDLIIDLTDHYNMSLPTLFLGTRKGAKDLVHKTAQHKTLGC